MNQPKTDRFNQFYQQQLKTLKLQGISKSTISSYSRSLRRVTSNFDCCPDELDHDQFKDYFSDLAGTHSWSTVKADRLELQHFGNSGNTILNRCLAE